MCIFSESEHTSSAASIHKSNNSLPILLVILFNGQGFLSFILIFKTTSLPHDKRTAGESCTMIRSTFKRLLDQHWVGIRKDQGQTEDICKGDLFVHWGWLKRTFKKKIKLVFIHLFHVPYLRWQREKTPWLPPNYKHFPRQKPEGRLRQLIKPNCFKVQASEIQARRKVVLKERLKTGVWRIT